jgi:hypothetical protein
MSDAGVHGFDLEDVQLTGAPHRRTLEFFCRNKSASRCVLPALTNDLRNFKNL